MVHPKIPIAQQMLREMGIDLWMIVCSEASDVHSPYLLGVTCYSRHAIIIPSTGKSSVIIHQMEGPMVERQGTVDEIVTYRSTREFVDKLKEVVLSISEKPKIALNFVENLYEEGGDPINTITYGDVLALQKLFPGATFVSAKEILEKLTLTKSAEEIRLHEKAIEITLKAMKAAIEFIKSGVSECEVAAEAEYVMRKEGAGTAFSTIVASGPNSADPHHETSERKIGRDDVVILDMGAKYKLMAADITWTVFVGKNPPKDLEKIYRIVLDAKREATNALRPGIKGWEVDKAARDVIYGNGFSDEHFSHGTGHPLGLVVHGLGPALTKKEWSKRAELELVPTMIVTIEPGIYIRGKYGVRLEDDVLITEDGRRILSKTPDSLLTIT